MKLSLRAFAALILVGCESVAPAQTADTPPPPPPAAAAPSTEFAIPEGTWVARPLVGSPAPGMFYASWHVGGKHGRAAFNTVDGRIWFMGGDWYSWNDPNREDGNGNNEVWSYGVTEDSWRKEYPPGPTPCAPAGDLVPAQPDESTWVYDSRRNRFYTGPGFWFGVNGYRQHCADATPVQGGLVFDPVARKYGRPPFSAPPGGWGGDLHAKSGVYDPDTDSLYRFAYRSDMVVEQLRLSSNRWSTSRVGIREAYVEQDPMAIDVRGRQIYGIDYKGKRLVRWGIDRSSAKAWPLPRDYAWNCPGEECFDSNNGLLSFDVANRALLIPNMPSKGGRIVKVFVFWVDQERFEELPLVQPAGAIVNGNTMAYDPVNNVHLLIGGRVTPHFFLFRLRGSGPAGGKVR